VRAVRLPGSVHLVAAAQIGAQLARKNADHPSLPRSLAEIHAELNARPDGTPVVPDQSGQRGDLSLLVHGSTWVMRLFPTHVFQGSRRGYRVAAIDPLRLRDHHRLAGGYLAVRPRSWELVSVVQELGPHADAHFDRLLAEWARYASRNGAAAPEPVGLPSHHATFLDTLEQVIDTNERITTAAVRDARPFTYRKVEPVGDRRHGTHSAYEFVLTGPPPKDDAFVQISGEPEQRGQVTRTHDRSATVRFDIPVDWARIPKVGDLELTPSTVVFRKQREAVNMLRAGASHNPAVLDVLVDHRTRQLAPAPDDPAASLDDSQLHAFRSALGATDLMAILGPPGTGKTRVISQIANAAAIGSRQREPQRVLITSHTNRAVDNVLQRLPDDLVVVRVGGGSVTEEGRPYLLETQARELRGRILGTVATSLDGLGHLDVAGRWATELGDRTAAFGAAVAGSARAREQFDAARRDAGGPAATEHHRLAAAQDERGRRLAQLDQAAQRAFLRTKGFFARFWQWRRGRVLARTQRLRAEQEQAGGALAAAARRLDEITRKVPAVLAAKDGLIAAAGRADQARTDAFTAAHNARAVVGNHQAPPPLHDGGPNEEAHARLTALSAWLAEWIPVLHRRAQLLADWQREVSDATDQLSPELVRYADVIAATAIGTASRPELSEVDFGLVIVDEAGQIGTADVLVPLVRARRAVLVGDHQQLPPFLDSEVAVWGKDVDDDTVRLLLSHSALELLAGGLPRANVAPLTEQRRMPAVIAEFISRTFYDGRLRTAVVRDHDDRLFAGPFAFVDTARLAEGRRRERPAGDRDRGQRGHWNRAEADLLVKLAAHYDGLGREWAVIVPYRAQVKEITTALVRRIGEDDKVRLNVGSVDSFQGGERDVILYGFTRSNPDGHVGFLSELRRANVAFTRAKRQLVLVGDLSTLTNARDQPFRELARALRDHVARHGEIRQYEEIDAKL
jgi:hypothetical protein